MRRISVWMAVLMMVFIGAADMMGLEFDHKKTEAALKLEASGKEQIEGRIAEVVYVSEEHFRMLLDSETDGKILYNVFGKTQDSIYELPGRQAVIRGEIRCPDTSDNPGMFDYRQYLRTEGIYLTGECSFENISVIGMDPDPLKGVLINRVSIFKSDFCRRMDEVREGSAGLFSGMLFGDRSRMPEEVYDSFRENGTAHILSVSGLHVGIIYGAANGIMGKRRKSLAAVCISAAMLAACALLASFSISVMRAVTMIAFHMLAERTHRRYDLISAACITAVIFMMINPYVYGADSPMLDVIDEIISVETGTTQNFTPRTDATG
ncbi:MAG: ComEC/Rec2 family competence protein, partial [Firmicutes bacterium]|nr:ComEC/Rec2 family competence protein [Bacillota bacterium]